MTTSGPSSQSLGRIMSSNSRIVTTQPDTSQKGVTTARLPISSLLSGQYGSPPSSAWAVHCVSIPSAGTGMLKQWSVPPAPGATPLSLLIPVPSCSVASSCIQLTMLSRSRSRVSEYWSSVAETLGHRSRRGVPCSGCDLGNAHRATLPAG